MIGRPRIGCLRHLYWPGVKAGESWGYLGPAIPGGDPGDPRILAANPCWASFSLLGRDMAGRASDSAVCPTPDMHMHMHMHAGLCTGELAYERSSQA